MDIQADFGGVFRRRFILLLGAMVTPYVCMFAVLAAIGLALRSAMPLSQPVDPRDLWNSFGLLPKVGVFVAFGLSAFSPYAVGIAGVSLITWEDRQGKIPAAREIAARVWPLVPRLMVLGFLTGVGTLFGSFLLVIPGILLAAVTAFAVPSLVIEELSVAKALRRSIVLAKHDLFAVAGMYLLVFALTFGLQIVATRWMGGSIALALSVVFFLALAIHVSVGVLITLFYCQARSRVES